MIRTRPAWTIRNMRDGWWDGRMDGGLRAATSNAAISDLAAIATPCSKHPHTRDDTLSSAGHQEVLLSRQEIA